MTEDELFETALDRQTDLVGATNAVCETIEERLHGGLPGPVVLGYEEARALLETFNAWLEADEMWEEAALEDKLTEESEE